MTLRATASLRMYARVTGKEEDTIRKDLMRDNFMSAEEAKDYGLIDQAAGRSW